MTFLRVKNLSKHQHYKDRRPPWIKLHAEVLDDYAFACLQDASKVHLMLIWVLASRMDNLIPNDPAWIARKISATESVDVDALVSAGFIEVCGGDGEPASATLASRTQTAMPETEEETETETETKGSRRAAGASRKPRAAKAKAEPAPWMGDVRTVWRQQFPGSEPKRGTAESLRPAMRDHGPEVVLPRLAVYLRKVPAQHMNLNTFAGTVLAPDWTPEGVRPTGAVPAGALSADVLLTACDDAGLSSFSGSRDGYFARVDALAEKLGQSAEEFRALVKTIKPWDLPGTFRPERVRTLEGRLTAARQAVAA